MKSLRHVKQHQLLHFIFSFICVCVLISECVSEYMYIHESKRDFMPVKCVGAIIHTSESCLEEGKKILSFQDIYPLMGEGIAFLIVCAFLSSSRAMLLLHLSQGKNAFSFYVL